MPEGIVIFSELTNKEPTFNDKAPSAEWYKLRNVRIELSNNVAHSLLGVDLTQSNFEEDFGYDNKVFSLNHE